MYTTLVYNKAITIANDETVVHEVKACTGTVR